ncbi:MAG: toxin co-regulated pilus biosynthesis Q family protein, partial [Gammaproteobacteria bacterium]|nr:toxin co-regulated pilus biosynthesis Q family protein [Gammaproteobacteria bacterium]
PKSPAPGMSNTVSTPNDKVAQQAPLAHVDTSSTVKPPLTRPAPAPKPMFTTTAMPGSLKANVERIVAQSHWGTVVWNLPIDYNWKGTMTISAPNVQGALSQLLAQYPVQATFYDKNRIVSIEARRVI